MKRVGQKVAEGGEGVKERSKIGTMAQVCGWNPPEVKFTLEKI